MSFEIRVGRQAFLEALQSGLPLDVCAHETLREHRVGSHQRDGIRQSLFNLARFWPLFFDDVEEFKTENPTWLRQLDAALQTCLEKPAEELLKLHEQKKPRAEKDITAHLRRWHPIKNFFFEEMKSQPADWHDYLHSQLGPAPFTVRLNPNFLAPELFLERYKSYAPRASDWIPNAFHFGKRWNIAEDPGFQDGFFEVQDEHSQLIALLSRVQPGQHVLDLCAGAGGKTLHLASLMQNRGEVHAYDVSKKKLMTLSERARRAGLTNVRICADVPRPGSMRFDTILIDAPCSGLGTLRRSPDRLLHLKSSELVALRRTQRQLLQQALPLLKPGGQLIYATCTVRPEENLEPVREILQPGVLELADPQPALRAALGTVSDNFLTLLQTSPSFRLSTLSNLSQGLQLGPTQADASQTSGALVGDGFFVALVNCL